MKGIDCEIIDIGVAATPLVENVVRAFKADGGIIITASHNEPEFNGLKFLDSSGAVLNPEDSEFVIKRVHGISNIDFENFERKIVEKEREAVEEYKSFLREILKTDKIDSVKVLVDVNGGTGFVAKEIFEEYGVDSCFINIKVGEFERLVEPNENSLGYLQSKMQEKDCDFAVGFDCDADRVEILLKNGKLVSGNQILALIAEQILSDAEKKIVVNDATSYVVKEVVQKHGAEFIEVEVGETNVVNKMIEANSKIGGEGSNGGVIIAPSRCRDGIMTILFLLKLISEKNKTLEDLIGELPRYYYLKEKVKLGGDFINIRDRVKEYYLGKGFSVLETGGRNGGLKFIKDDSWIWFRQSKTETKVLRIIVDSKDKIVAEGLMREGKKLVQ